MDERAKLQKQFGVRGHEWARAIPSDCGACDLLGPGRFSPFPRQAQLFQPLGFLPASALLGLDGFPGGSLGVFETILPVSL